MVYYVRALDQRRAADWDSLFGVDRLPVKAPRPRFQSLEPGRGDTLAYDLAVDALHPMQRERLARHVAKESRIPVDEARAIVETSAIPIRARGTELVERTQEGEANAG